MSNDGNYYLPYFTSFWISFTSNYSSTIFSMFLTELLALLVSCSLTILLSLLSWRSFRWSFLSICWPVSLFSLNCSISYHVLIAILNFHFILSLFMNLSPNWINSLSIDPLMVTVDIQPWYSFIELSKIIYPC